MNFRNDSIKSLVLIIFKKKIDMQCKIYNLDYFKQ
jgi:hypothetical protein